MTSRTSYIGIFAALATTAILSIAAINIAVDPWAYFKTPDIAGFNLVKPELPYYERELEAQGLKTLQPKGIVMGASNSDVGLDPEHTSWEVQPGYNVAAGLGSITLANRLLEHALVFGTPEKIVLGLEFGMFHPAYQNDAGINPTSLARNIDGERNRDYLGFNFYANAFSLQMLKSSAKTLLANIGKKDAAKTYRPALTASGMLDPENFGNPSWKTYRLHFQNNIAYATRTFWAPAEQLASIDIPAEEPTFESYRRILALACENEIELYLLFAPSHAYVLVGQETLGLTDFWERWQHAIVTTTAEFARETGCPQPPVWDFSGYNEVTTEIISNERGKEHFSTWYWDPLHYRVEVGNDMLNRMFGKPAINPVFDDIGTVLTPANIDEVIRQKRQGLINYRKNHPDEYALVMETVETALE